jgi:methylated-DNA-[protein]-cysteine S-methyltransferase
MAERLHLFLDRTQTPIGQLAIVADSEGRLRLIYFIDHEEDLDRALRRHYRAGGYVIEPKQDPYNFTTAMDSYFEGDLSVIENLPVETGGTTFQREVWKALREIPCGTTWSYSELAQRIGNPAAVRAVGLANGSNPVSIVVPCHRVIGANGTLTGYGGGLERKRWLLAHEATARPGGQLSFAL